LIFLCNRGKEEAEIMTTFNFTGKKTVVTGANRGMGFAIAKAFFDSGSEVVLLDISDEVVNTAKQLDPSGERVFGVQGDVGVIPNIEGIFKKCLDKLNGEIDILVNCAGISKRGACENFPIDDWESVMNVNANALFFLCQYAGREMLEKGSGKIINIASMLSFLGSAGSIAYSASKGAVAQITKSLCISWGARGINVNAVAPGWVNTELTGPMRQNTELTERISKRIPMARWAEPEDIAGPVLFLASDNARYINGAILLVDGGYMAG
jgi:2-dehydro-3-deoxy-D-gluconate 5-dehydrogenase